VARSPTPISPPRDARFLTHYYAPAVLASPLARKAFILPGFSPVPHGPGAGAQP